MAIAGIGGVAGSSGLNGLAQLYRQQVGGADTPGGAVSNPAKAAKARSDDFTAAVGDGLQRLEGLDRTAQQKSVQAATGDLTDVHDYVIAATEAQTATELTTTVRNKALEAFNEIMRMPL